MESQSDKIVLGRISGVFGIKGWVKVFSYTGQRDSILDYSPWLVRIAGEWKSFKVNDGQVQGKGIIVRLDGVVNREQAQLLVGCDIGVSREQLQALREGEYYWADLIGMSVVTVSGVVLGRVDTLFETGSNDVMVVRGERERLVPWIMDDVVKSVSLEGRVIQVEWDPDF